MLLFQCGGSTTYKYRCFTSLSRWRFYGRDESCLTTSSQMLGDKVLFALYELGPKRCWTTIWEIIWKIEWWWLDLTCPLARTNPWSYGWCCDSYSGWDIYARGVWLPDKKPLVSQLADLHSWRSRRERWHQISPNHLCVWFLDSTQNESWAGTLHIITFLFPQDQHMARQSTSARMVFDWSDHNGLFPSVCVQPLCEPTALFGVDPCIQRRQTFHTFRSDWDSGMVWYLTWNRLVASLEPHSWPVPMSAKVGTKMFLGSVSHGTHHHFFLTSLRAKSCSLGLTGVVIVLSRL